MEKSNPKLKIVWIVLLMLDSSMFALLEKITGIDNLNSGVILVGMLIICVIAILLVVISIRREGEHENASGTGEFIAGFNWKFFAIAYAITIIPLYLIECKGENVSPHIALLVIVSCVLLVCHAIPLMYFRKKLLSGQ